jgi:hypothetical protein
MKKFSGSAGIPQKIKKRMIFFAALIFFGCGLDNFYYLEPPRTDGHVPYYDTADKTLRYFSFLTNEEDNNDNLNSDFNFQGTEVYYKIHNNYSALVSAQNSVTSLNKGSDVSAAAENLVTTRNYKTLNLDSGAISPLIKNDDNDRYVYIRLNRYGTDEKFSAVVCYSSAKMASYDSSDSRIVKLGVPRRNINLRYGFNFSSDDSVNPPPKNGDEDVNWSSSTSVSGTWYVDMWAVSVGRDSSYSKSYSKLLHLGAVAIEQSDYEN